MRCYYCENEATKKDYRTWDGITGKELVCNDCFDLSNDGLLNRRAKVDALKKELFTTDLAERFLEKGWGEMWDIINIEINDREEEMINEFESQLGHEPHKDTLEKWNDKMLTKIDKLIKKSI